jgi:hypothetical protein
MNKYLIASILAASAIGLIVYEYSPKQTIKEQTVSEQVITPPTVPVVPEVKQTPEPTKTTVTPLYHEDGQFNLDNVKLITGKTFAKMVMDIYYSIPEKELNTSIGRTAFVERIKILDKETYNPMYEAMYYLYVSDLRRYTELKIEYDKTDWKTQLQLIPFRSKFSEFKTTVINKNSRYPHYAFVTDNARSIAVTYRELETIFNQKEFILNEQQKEKYDAQLKQLGELEATRWGVFNRAKLKVKEIKEALSLSPDDSNLKLQLAEAEQNQLLAWEGPDGVQVIREQRSKIGQEKNAPLGILRDTKKAILEGLGEFTDNKKYVEMIKYKDLTEKIDKLEESITQKIKDLPKE